MQRLLMALVVTLFVSVPCAAGTPSDAAKAYFEKLQAGDYAALSEAFDPAALRGFREMMSFIHEVPAEARGELYAAFFGPGATQASVKEMSDQEYFGRFLQGVMNQIAGVGALNFDRLEILGEVPEGSDVVHVLTRNRTQVGEVSVEAMEVMSFRNVNGRWLAQLSGEIKGMAAQLKAAIPQ